MISLENVEDDLNIWMESPNNIIYDADKNQEIGIGGETEIQAASLNKLVEALSAENKHGTLKNPYNFFKIPTI